MLWLLRLRWRPLAFVLVALMAITGCADRATSSSDAGAPDDSASASGRPIGGGVAGGTGVDTELSCPPGVEEDQTEWFGPADGHTLQGAVAEAFNDLIVGWIGEPFELQTTDDWSSWGLRDDDGNLVAVATVVSSSGGWDPSHARFCVMPPQSESPPPPFTLYVSNQSFEDPNVHITIAIDGVVVVDQGFAVEGQHNWFTFEPDVPPGEHTLTASSNTGADLTVEFATKAGRPRWAVVDYWWYPGDGARHFTFDIFDEPVGFA